MKQTTLKSSGTTRQNNAHDSSFVSERAVGTTRTVLAQRPTGIHARSLDVVFIGGLGRAVSSLRFQRIQTNRE